MGTPTGRLLSLTIFQACSSRRRQLFCQACSYRCLIGRGASWRGVLLSWFKLGSWMASRMTQHFVPAKMVQDLNLQPGPAARTWTETICFIHAQKDLLRKSCGGCFVGGLSLVLAWCNVLKQQIGRHRSHSVTTKNGNQLQVLVRSNNH